jgi:hypothetical protein
LSVGTELPKIEKRMSSTETAHRQMRPYTTKEKVKITAGAMAALIIVG